jgi:hypothetical protein
MGDPLNWQEKNMKKIITTLTAVTFALGLAAAAQAQMAKTPEKPVVQTTQAVQPQVTPKPGDPVAKETVKPGDKAKEAAQSVDKGKAKKEAKQVAPKAKIENKAVVPVEKTQEGAK